MSSTYWTLSTGRPGDYSAGTLRTDSTRRWSPALSIDLPANLGGSPTVTIAWSQDLQTGRLAHIVTFEAQETQGIPKLDLRQVVRRVICHLLVATLPDEALPEVCDALRDLYLFYSAPPLQLELQSTPPQRVTANPGKTYDRPDLQVTEE